MNSDVEKVLITEEQINARISELARDINEFYKGEPVVVVSILKGGAVFTVDLIKRLNMDVTLDFACVSSYGSETVSSGELIVKRILTLILRIKTYLLQRGYNRYRNYSFKASRYAAKPRGKGR